MGAFPAERNVKKWGLRRVIPVDFTLKAKEDMGKVIGRNGSVAKALRTLLKVAAARDGGSVSLEIL